jgi:hypothetical protein
MDEIDLFTSEDIDKFRRTRRAKDIVRTKALLEREPINPKRSITLIEVGKRIKLEQDKAHRQYEEKIKTIRQKGIETARQYRTSKEVKKEQKIMRPSDIIGVGKTGIADEDKPKVKDKHIHYAKKYGIPFEVNGYRRTYEDLLKAIKAYEESNINNIMKKGLDKKTKEYGMYIE